MSFNAGGLSVGDLEKEPLYLGIDGGGTSCRARLRNADGVLLGEGMGGAANARLAPEMVRMSILDAASGALSSAGLDETHWSRVSVALGLAGAGQPAARQRVLELDWPFAQTVVETDAYTAWLGATRGGKGAILIVGTGVCGFMIANGERISIGGWGSIVSDDGGGAVIGREAVRRILWVHDGLASRGSMFRKVSGVAGHTPEDIVEWVDRATPADFARIAPIVLNAAISPEYDGPDPLAQGIMHDAGMALSRLIRRLRALGAPTVSILGGLSEHIVPWLAEDMRDCIVPPAHDALDGAIMMIRPPQ